MGRPSNLSDAKWAELEKRLLDGEKAADLAKEYKVSRSAISKRFSKQHEEVKSVATQIVSAEEALMRLPVSQQVTAINLASQLRSISQHLASAANYGAATAHRLTALANAEVQKVDDANPLQSLESLRGVATLTKLANDSASIGLNLISANKDRIKQLDGEEQRPADQDLTDLTDEELQVLERLAPKLGRG